jgi:hypothetical protein
MITLRVRQTVASSALMQNARPRRRRQASQPRSGAPKAQGLTVAIAVAASSKMPSIAKHAHNSIGATAPIGTSPTLRIYTSLTDVTKMDAMAAKGTGNAARRTDETLGNLRALFGANFRHARQKTRLTQTDVQELTGIRQHYISEIGNGVQNLTLDTMVTLAGALKTRDN